MKVRPHSFVLLAALVALCVSWLAVPASVLAAEGTATAKPAAAKPAADAKAGDDEPTAAERRAASSEFEREKLDQGAFKDADEAATGEGGGGKESSGSALRFVFGLVVVLGAIFGVHWLLKRWGQSRMQGVAGKAGVIDVVATTPLAQGRALHLVRVGEELVLVGATEQSITRIGDVDANLLASSPGGQGSGSAEFQSMLAGAMYSGQPGVPAGMGGTATKDPFLKRFLDNLRLSTAR